MQLISQCLYEAEAIVEQVFFLVSLLILQTGYLAEISLLGVLFMLLQYCTKFPSRVGARKSLANGFRCLHYGILLVLIAVWAAALGLKIASQVEYAGYPLGALYRYGIGYVEYIRRLNTAYAIIYAFGSAWVLAWAVTGFLNQDPANGRRVCIDLSIQFAEALLNNVTARSCILRRHRCASSHSLYLYHGRHHSRRAPVKRRQS